MPQTIYCDESGFTGNNLLDTASPFFTYAAIAIDSDPARELVEKTIRDFRLDGTELKGQRLVRHSRGCRAVTSVLGQCADRAQVLAIHKRYALATKFFEYIFEPVLAEQNSIFYNAGFHRFISNILYVEALARADRALTALTAFQEVMRARDASALPSIFPSGGIAAEYSEVLREIEAFVVCHHDVIAQDIAAHAGNEPLYAWMLDLSATALYSLLTALGERHDSMLVYCDDSKPLRDMRESFDMMIGRKDRAYVTFEGKQQSLIFNLAEPLMFVSSHEYPGVQIADVFSSALSWAVRNPREDRAKSWLGILRQSFSDFSIFPDAEVVDLGETKTVVNRLILHELVERSVRKESLFDGMPAFIAAAREVVGRHPHALSD